MFLLSKTPYTLPDNPSSKGFSAHQIKSAMYSGYIVLFEWLKRMGEEANGSLTEINASIEDIKDTAVLGGSMFVPALQPDEPNERKVKVWLQTDGDDSKADGTQEEIPKTKNTLSFGPVAEKLDFEGEEKPFVIDYDPDEKKISFGDEGGSLTFGDGANNGEKLNFEETSDADELKFGD